MAAKKSRKSSSKKSARKVKGQAVAELPAALRQRIQTLRADGKMPYIDSHGNIRAAKRQVGAKKGHRSCR